MTVVERRTSVSLLTSLLSAGVQGFGIGRAISELGGGAWWEVA